MGMKEYLEKVLHRDVQLSAYADMPKLPLIYHNAVRFEHRRAGVSAD